tara:strand:+ start:6296 stop:7261 length:966 start_codon:yes stop_codon:yes gene_type:complete
MTQLWNTKLIIVTGGFGFIGSRFVKAVLENTSYNVKIIDKETYAADTARVYGWTTFEQQFRVRHSKKDITEVTYADVVDADYIVNFAAESHVDNSIEDGKPFIRSNIEGTFNLLEQARRIKGLKKFVQISTDEVYGDMHDLRGKQSADESFKLRPSSYYSASKASADLLVESAARTFGVPYLITRSCNNFGPGQDPEKFLPKAFESIKKGKEIPVYGDGLQSREWIHVDDNAQVILDLLLSAAKDEVYNIGSGYHYKNIELINYISDCLGVDVAYSHVSDRLGHDRVYRLNNSKTEKFLGERVYQTLEGFLKDQANEFKGS